MSRASEKCYRRPLIPLFVWAIQYGVNAQHDRRCGKYVITDIRRISENDLWFLSLF